MEQEIPKERECARCGVKGKSIWNVHPRPKPGESLTVYCDECALIIWQEGKINKSNIMEPTIGRVVIFNTDEQFRNSLKSKGDFDGQYSNHEQNKLPATIVAVWGDDCVNLKVSVDGHGPDVWVTSRMRGDNEGEWNWPERK